MLPMLYKKDLNLIAYGESKNFNRKSKKRRGCILEEVLEVEEMKIQI